MQEKIKKFLRNRLIFGLMLQVGAIIISAIVLTQNNSDLFEKLSNQYIVIFAAIVNIVIFAYYILPIVYSFATGKYKKNIEKIVERFNIPEKRIEYEYDNAVSYGKVKISTRFMFYAHADKFHVIPIEDVVWVYKKKKTNTTTKVTYTTKRPIEELNRTEHWFCIIRTVNHKTITIPFTKIQILDDLMDEFATYAHILVGFDNHYKNLYLNSFKKFLDLKYYEVFPAKDSSKERSKGGGVEEENFNNINDGEDNTSPNEEFHFLK